MKYSHCAFYIGQDRYNQFNSDWGWICVADEDQGDDKYIEAVNWIDAGDNEALAAGHVIKQGLKDGHLQIAFSTCPADAVRKVCNLIDAS